MRTINQIIKLMSGKAEKVVHSESIKDNTDLNLVWDRVQELAEDALDIEICAFERDCPSHVLDTELDVWVPASAYKNSRLRTNAAANRTRMERASTHLLQQPDGKVLIIHRDDPFRSIIARGIRKLVNAVKVTYGPKGRNVVLQKPFGPPTVTKDGVTVAKEIEFDDKYENMGARMVREVASKTNDVAGDGTTTATILAEAIYSEGIKYVLSGINPMSMKRGIEKAVEDICGKLRSMSIAVNLNDRRDITNIASVASNQDAEIGNMLAEAIGIAGKDGVITIEEGKTLATELEFVEGIQFDRGYLSPYFVTDPHRMEVILEDVYFLIHEKKISNIRAMIPLMEMIAKTKRPLLIISEDVDGEALAMLVVNKLRGIFSCAAVKAPGYGDRRKALLEDIAILTGGKAFFEDLELQLESVTLNDLGQAKQVIIDKDNTTIIEGAGKKDTIRARIGQLKNEFDSSTSDYDKEKLSERIAKLSGGVAKIQVGAATASEMKEKKMRVEDALHATRAALEEGYLPGGGVALLRAATSLTSKGLAHDEEIGYRIIIRACSSPLRQISENAGKDGDIVEDQVLASNNVNFGFDARNGEYVDLVKMGIIDPTKVVRVALQNAASVATLLLTTEVLIADPPRLSADGRVGP